MKVKICGITNLDDALCACEFGADAIGFVFYGKSPRLVSQETARIIAEKLPPFVKKVGLFVEQTTEEIDCICTYAKLDLAQIHTETDDRFFNRLKTPFLKVVRAKKREDLTLFLGEYRLIDAFTKSYGGEGKCLPIEWFKDYDKIDRSERDKIILAGGLNLGLLDKIAPLGFYGIDVSSGVEKNKGIKDRALIKEFLLTAKAIQNE
ncbi:MAG: phosphoribosylanthranilate isomerase [Helicobacteraceae bacterium]|jgi:phosphoribosylanthranilate isomerase|nr:phosphoribosylanthranilate isomerase [Helicobacteraceae bacterium]